MKMTRISYLFLLFLLPAFGYSQQIPLYSQYIWNAYLINPAIGGAENFLDIKAGYRNQWTGLDGAPTSLYLTANMQLGKKVLNREDKDVINREGGDASDKGGFAKVLGYKTPSYPNIPSSYQIKPHHGVGLQVMVDQVGIFSTLAIYGNYAYHLPLTNKVYASMGTFFGIKQYKIDADEATTDQPGDQAIGSTGNLTGITPDAMAGFMVYSEKFYVGLSANQILNINNSLRNKAEKYVSATAELEPHFFLTGGYRFKVGSDFAFVPSTLVRYFPGTDISADLTGKFNYLDLIWAGVSYRAAEAVVMLVGVSYGNKIDIGYSYDMSASKRNKDIRLVSHEILLGYRMINNTTSGRPSFVW